MSDKQKQQLNDEQIVSYLQGIVDKIRTEEDPLVLNDYRRLFRKAVPFTLRSYFAAWILKEINTGKNIGKPGMPHRGDRNDRGDRSGRRERNEGRNEGRNERAPRESASTQESASGKKDRVRQNESRRGENRPEPRAERTEQVKSEPRPVLADDVSTTLFISIGRNRRVYPRDLIGLILQNTGIDREHIGDIRVLDNYSFVQVITEDAPKIIEVLNEFDYRGRKLAVSYSRKREESADAASSETSSLSGDEQSSVSDDLDSSENFSDESSASWKDEADLSDDEENNGNI